MAAAQLSSDCRLRRDPERELPPLSPENSGHRERSFWGKCPCFRETDGDNCPLPTPHCFSGHIKPSSVQPAREHERSSCWRQVPHAEGGSAKRREEPEALKVLLDQPAPNAPDLVVLSDERVPSVSTAVWASRFIPRSGLEGGGIEGVGKATVGFNRGSATS